MAKLVPAAAAVSGAEKPCERAILFPQDRSLGYLYSRKAKGKRWFRCADARGRVLLDPERRYRLKMTGPVYGAAEGVRLLDGIDCDQLEEVVIWMPISSKIFFQEAVSGTTRWLYEFLAKEQAELANGLKTTARVVLKTSR